MPCPCATVMPGQLLVATLNFTTDIDHARVEQSARCAAAWYPFHERGMPPAPHTPGIPDLVRADAVDSPRLAMQSTRTRLHRCCRRRLYPCGGDGKGNTFLPRSFF